MKIGGKKRVVGVLVVVALIGAGWLFFGHNNEPRYEGKPVSYWFKEFYSRRTRTEDDANRYNDAAAALSGMGNNALPFLVKVAFSTNEDSAARTNFYNLLAKLPDSWHLPQLITQDDIREASMEAIRRIGPSANDILPLVQSELDATNTQLRRQAVFILGFVSNNVELLVPIFAKALHDPDQQVQYQACEVLADMGSKASAALPDLMEVFQSAAPGGLIRRDVIYALGCIGSNAVPAIPLLKVAFENETDWPARCRIASCLCTIDSGQTYALDYLIGVMTNNPTAKQIDLAAFCLGSIGPSAKLSIPVLLDALKTTNCDFGPTGTVLRALQRLGASNDQILAVLVLKLDSDSNIFRDYIFNVIRRLDPSGRVAMSALIDIVDKRSQNEAWAIDRLSNMGSKAREAIPVLQEALNSTNSAVRINAMLAIREIDPKNAGK